MGRPDWQNLQAHSVTVFVCDGSDSNAHLIDALGQDVVKVARVPLECPRASSDLCVVPNELEIDGAIECFYDIGWGATVTRF
jgi:hypothetical protein